jgi:hypothetical protein
LIVANTSQTDSQKQFNHVWPILSIKIILEYSARIFLAKSECWTKFTNFIILDLLKCRISLTMINCFYQFKFNSEKYICSSYIFWVKLKKNILFFAKLNRSVELDLSKRIVASDLNLFLDCFKEAFKNLKRTTILSDLQSRLRKKITRGLEHN